MEKRTLKGTNIDVSRACLGTMTFGKQADEKSAATMLDMALDAGVNFVDAANVYNAGASEEILGRILEGRRNRVVLASKVGIKVGDDDSSAGLAPQTIVNQVEKSLSRLRTAEEGKRGT